MHKSQKGGKGENIIVFFKSIFQKVLTVNKSPLKYASKPSNAVINSFNFCGMRGSGKKWVRPFSFLKFSYMSKMKECKGNSLTQETLIPTLHPVKICS